MITYYYDPKHFPYYLFLLFKSLRGLYCAVRGIVKATADDCVTKAPIDLSAAGQPRARQHNTTRSSINTVKEFLIVANVFV